MRDDGFETLVKICAEAGGGLRHLGARSRTGCALRPLGASDGARAPSRAATSSVSKRVWRKRTLEALTGVVREDVLARREDPPDLGMV
jgi:hypothetical protein